MTDARTAINAALDALDAATDFEVADLCDGLAKHLHGYDAAHYLRLAAEQMRDDALTPLERAREMGEM